MDTILASIRRILNEDEVSTPAEAAPKPRDEAAAPEPNKPAEPDRDDVLVLGESMMVPPEPIEPPALSRPPEPPPAAASVEGLVAARTRAAAAQSFDALHEAMQRAQTPPSMVNSPTLLRAGGPTVEDLVRDELRSLLSNWLDVHLPALVETLVRLEIEKLTRR